MTFEEILEQEGVEFITEGHEHCRPGWIQLDCPWCSPGWKHYRLGYNLRYGYVNCWSCGGHNLLETLVALTGLSYPEAKEKLDQVATRWVEEERTRPKGTYQPPPDVMSMRSAHKDYLRSRGFDPERIAKIWKVRGIGNHGGEFRWRLFIPIFHLGKKVSWTTRILHDRGTRYRSAGALEESYPHKELLYGEEHATNSILVVEGPTDVWKIGRGAAATFGTSFTRAQVVRISRYPTRVICSDNEPEAQAQARKLMELLEIFPGVTLNVQLDAKDPGTASPREIQQLRKLIR